MKKTVVITGATRGIGRGLACEFLRAGCRVFICGRSGDSTAAAVADLAGEYEDKEVAGLAADVSRFDQVEALWRAARDRFGRVDIWINNAGIGSRDTMCWECSGEEIRSVAETNLIGAMNGCAVAARGMIEQGGGAVYNMEGLGSRGPVVPGTALYAASKAGVTRFTRGLVRDVTDTTVIAGFLSPGMVVTELLIGPDVQAIDRRTRRAYNILADRVETVAPYLARGVLNNTRNGARIDWLPGWKIGWRFMTSAARRGRLFPES